MKDPIDLAVKLGPLTLKNPFLVGSGPTVRTVDQVKAAEDAGWAGVSLKLTIDPEPYLSLPPRYRWLPRQRMHIFTAERRLAPVEGLRLMEQARGATKGIAIFANVSHDGPDLEGWGSLARRFQDAGAHAIELNMCCPNMSFNLATTGERTAKATGASLGGAVEGLPAVVAAVVGSVAIPVIVKLTPEGGRIADAAQACVEAGATAVGSTANRLGIPDIDIRDPQGTIYRLQENITIGCLSGPWIRPLALRDTYQMRQRLGPGPFIIGSGGVSDLSSAVQQIMAGAGATWICTATILRGFSWMAKLIEELRSYMADMGWTRIEQFRGMLLHNIRSAGDLVIREGYAMLDPLACTGCGRCWELGACHAISHVDGRTAIDARRCTGCSTCVDVCEKRAIQMREA